MNNESTNTIEIRRADLADMSDVVQLCIQHAAHERMHYDPAGKRERLVSLLLAEDSTMECLIARCADRGVAYAAFAVQYSTWQAASYLYLDCLYVKAEFRGLGLGKQLMSRVHIEAKRRGCSEVQWQTPTFNTEAVQFYDSIENTSRLAKWRYGWPV